MGDGAIADRDRVPLHQGITIQTIDARDHVIGQVLDDTIEGVDQGVLCGDQVEIDRQTTGVMALIAMEDIEEEEERWNVSHSFRLWVSEEAARDQFDDMRSEIHSTLIMPEERLLIANLAS